MGSKLMPEVIQFTAKMAKPDVLSRGVPARLPEAYRKFYEEWRAPASPVHYRPEPGKWKRDPLTGEVWPVQNVPIPLRYPKEMHTGIWGGEAVILGYKTNPRKYRQKSTKWFVPNLERSAVYSEILDKRMSVIMTRRTIYQIIEHNGFDNYILESSTADLHSLLALKIKKKMLLALFDKTLYPEDPEKREKVYNKYKHHLDRFNKEDLEWFAMSVAEAVQKLTEMEDSVQPIPLKHQFRAELIEELKVMAENEELDKALEKQQNRQSSSESSWLTRINPFAKKS